MKFTHEEMRDELAKQVFAKAQWLADFSDGKRKRPDHEIETKRCELDVLQQAHDQYAQAAMRKAG